MKLRIKGNSLRLRLTKAEVARIALGEAVSEEICFSPGSWLVYSLEPSDNVKEIAARFEGNLVRVLLPLGVASDWAGSETISLVASQKSAENSSLSLLIEKDFFCLKPRAFEKENPDDYFTHPNHASGTCG